ncbi:MAG: 3-hydroxyacyl-CoA dehydrogenase [Phycisphaeraceae bacterium]|nr:3-hydroxyacyl-CoA dehydrogenase [Phycisphaeraceae bacterium]
MQDQARRKKLQDRVALITGAGRGIGRAIALLYAAHGAKVAVTARSRDELDEVAGGIADAGGEALVVEADLARRDAPARVMAQVNEAFGPVEILVNNAGIGSSTCPAPVVDFDDEFWDLSLALNLTAPYLLSKLALPEMLARGYGRIIMVASINGKMAAVHGAAYTASKHGLLGLMRTMATEVVAQGITVNAICPGPVATRMNDLRIEYDAARRGVSVEEHEKSATPMGRRLVPDEIAPMALYLAGDDGAAVTGQAFNIDGGVLMTV